MYRLVLWHKTSLPKMLQEAAAQSLLPIHTLLNFTTAQTIERGHTPKLSAVLELEHYIENT